LLPGSGNVAPGSETGKLLFPEEVPADYTYKVSNLVNKCLNDLRLK
jgi:hypothetical protein